MVLAKKSKLISLVMSCSQESTFEYVTSFPWSASPDDCRLRNDSAALEHTNWDEWEHSGVIISYFINL